MTDSTDGELIWLQDWVERAGLAGHLSWERGEQMLRAAERGDWAEVRETYEIALLERAFSEPELRAIPDLLDARANIVEILAMGPLVTEQALAMSDAEIVERLRVAQRLRTERQPSPWLTAVVSRLIEIRRQRRGAEWQRRNRSGSSWTRS